MAYHRKAGSEEELTFRVATYLRTHYPNTLYHVDFGSGTKLTMGQAVKNKRLNRRSWPDLLVAGARGGAHGLFIELKKQGTRLKKGDGMWASEHIAEQARTLEALAEAGYIAQFACGYDEATVLIDSYMSGASGLADVPADDPSDLWPEGFPGSGDPDVEAA